MVRERRFRPHDKSMDTYGGKLPDSTQASDGTTFRVEPGGTIQTELSRPRSAQPPRPRGRRVGVYGYSPEELRRSQTPEIYQAPPLKNRLDDKNLGLTTNLPDSELPSLHTPKLRDEDLGLTDIK